MNVKMQGSNAAAHGSMGDPQVGSMGKPPAGSMGGGDEFGAPAAAPQNQRGPASGESTQTAGLLF